MTKMHYIYIYIYIYILCIIYIYIYIYIIYIYIYIYNIVYIVIGAERPTLLLAHLMPNLKLHHRSYLNSEA